MSTPNTRTQAPVPDLTERQRQVYEMSEAPDVHTDRGPLLAGEALASDYGIRGSFVAGVLSADPDDAAVVDNRAR